MALPMKSKKETTGTKMPAGALATGWIIASLISQLPALWLMSLMSFLFLIPVQRTINQHNVQVAPSHDPNANFSGANWLWIVFGSLFLLLGVIGTLLPSEGV
jgi:hypothetical protein